MYSFYDFMQMGGMPQMKNGGDPDGEMAIGQIMAMHEKLSALQKFIQPDSDLEPWVASKLTLADDYLNSVADYMQYNPEENQEMQEMARGGYVVTRSHDRKGKTHKVTGPDGTVKYFGDAKLGQHPKDPKRKAAFYARHKKNLDRNPYFRAFARETWAEGGETDNILPIAQNGGDGGWLQRASTATLRNNELCRTFGRADMESGSGGGGGRESYPQYKDPFESLSDINNDLYFTDKESIKAVRRSKPDGVDKDMWNAINAEARRLNNTYTNKNYWGNNADPATGRLNDIYLADEWKNKINIPEFYRYYNNTPIKNKKSVSAQDLFEYYQGLPGGLETFKNLVNNKYMPQKKNGGYIGYDGKQHISNTPNWNGFAGFEMGGMPCYECGGMYAYGGIHIDPAKKGTFKAQATRMGMGVQEAASHIMANREDYSPAMVRKANFAKNFAKQMGGLVEGQELEVSPEELQMLKDGGYTFEII